MNFTDVNEDIIVNIINKLPNKNSCGYDNFSTKIIKALKDSLIKPLTLIINQILNTGVFPSQLKIAIVIPIFKKDDNKIFNNYRPISLLPALSKVVEKVICSQINNFFITNNLFYDSQYGFRSGHSTEYAAIEITDRIIAAMDKNNIPLNVYLDLSKAFDTLDHAILLEKLSHYGIRGNPLKLISSYLENRQQFVEFRNTKSSILQISTGVPQGSILGPLLFLIYINDFPSASSYFNFIMYTDDITLYSNINSPNENNIIRLTETKINTELAKINEWLKINKLSLNLKKSKYMVFKKTSTTNINLTLKIDQVVIDRVEYFNFLGLTIDSQMTWKNHTDNISNKCMRVIGTLNRIKHILPTQTRILLYNSLILPHINYCIMAWGYQSNRLFKLQKRAIRIVANSKYNTHTEPLFKLYRILKLADVLTLQTMKVYHKFRNNELPVYMQNWPLVTNNEIHRYNTRTATDLHTFKYRHTFAKKSLRHYLVQTIDNTPDNVYSKFGTHSLNGFSNYVKLHFINNYQDGCSIPNCYICSRI